MLLLLYYLSLQYGQGSLRTFLKDSSIQILWNSFLYGDLKGFLQVRLIWSPGKRFFFSISPLELFLFPIGLMELVGIGIQIPAGYAVIYLTMKSYSLVTLTPIFQGNLTYTCWYSYKIKLQGVHEGR